MRSSRIVLTLIVVAVAGGGLWLQRTRAAQAAAQSEADLQRPEIDTCKQRLKMFYGAWKQYRADHNDADPPSFEAMIPRYIKDPNALMCPTAARWQQKGHPLEQGSIPLNKRSYPVTYGFKWLAAGFRRANHVKDDATPLIVCICHREAMYRAEHGGKRLADPSDTSEEEYSNAGPRAVLAARYNGDVGPLRAGER